jgi:hypothetical protein
MVRKYACLAVIALVIVIVVPGFAADKPQFLTGQVSDSMCGAKHAMAGSAADCTRSCVKQGSAYALVVNDKVYTIATDDKAVLEQLDKAAGQNVTVTGTVNGDTLQATAVKPAK